MLTNIDLEFILKWSLRLFFQINFKKYFQKRIFGFQFVFEKNQYNNFKIENSEKFQLEKIEDNFYYLFKYLFVFK